MQKTFRGKTVEIIAEELEETEEKILPIYKVAEKYAPEYDIEKIYSEVFFSSAY